MKKFLLCLVNQRRLSFSCRIRSNQTTWIFYFYSEEFYDQFSLRIISKLFNLNNKRLSYVCGSDPSCQVITLTSIKFKSNVGRLYVTYNLHIDYMECIYRMLYITVIIKVFEASISSIVSFEFYETNKRCEYFCAVIYPLHAARLYCRCSHRC